MTDICREQFDSSLSANTAKALFKMSVNTIELGISSYCNRKCAYCPNSFVDRKSTRNFMHDEIFLNIISQLGAIGYAGIISLHRYNEPFADRDYALARIRQVRSIAPSARVIMYSNGDYLTKGFIEQLSDAGVGHLDVTTHAMRGDKDFTAIKVRLANRLRKLGMPFEYRKEKGDQLSAIVDTGGQMTLDWTAHNFLDENVRFDRAQSLQPSSFLRTDPCLAVFASLNVEWDGRVVPCCNIHLDVPGHDKYVLGVVDRDTNIFSLWANQSFVAWREELFSYELKRAPCTNCRLGCIGDNKELREFVANVRRSMIDRGASSTHLNP